MRCSSLGVLVVIAAAGCYEPPYRTEVVGNGQGGVEIHRVPKDPAETRAAAPVDASAQETIERQQKEIEELKALLRQRNDEIMRLTDGPTTQKASDHVPQN
jgi:hypothetical protein